MAEIVVGIGTSHTPMISMGSDQWSDHVVSWDARLPGYEEAVATAPDWLSDAVTPRNAAQIYAKCQSYLDHLRIVLSTVDPDVVVVFGDDQQELFLDDGVPTLAVYGGNEIMDLPGGRDLSASRLAAEWAFHGEEPSVIATDGAIGRHLAEAFTASGFGCNYLVHQPEGRSIGHAFTFISRRLAVAPRWSMVPVWMNTYYPPNQVTPSVAYRVGSVVRDAIRDWPGDERVAIVASGGLSHFYVDEALDRSVLDAIRVHDAETLCALGSERLQSGTSEILNWIAAAGAMPDFDISWERYVPAYRSLASTGVGVAAVVWSPPRSSRHFMNSESSDHDHASSH